MEIVNVLKRIFDIETESTYFKKKNGLTNEYIMKELVNRFQRELKQKSVGKRMIYPMTFIIFMHNDDYQICKDELCLFMDQVVDEFYRIICKHIKKYPTYINPAQYWTFRFIPTTMGKMNIDGHEVSLDNGQRLYIMANIFDVIEGKKASDSIQVSVTVGKTQTIKNININMEAFSNFPLENAPIIIKWKDPKESPKDDFSKSQSSNTPSFIPIQTGKKDSNANLQSLMEHSKSKMGNSSLKKARLIDNSTGRIYTITTDECYIYGKKVSSDSENIFRIDNDKINNPHARLRKNKITGLYSIVAFDKIILNDQQLPISKYGDDFNMMHWMPLTKSVNLDLNGSVVRFEYY